MKRNITLSLFLLLFTCFNLPAQETIIGDINYGTLEKYIQAAKDYYPRKKLYETNVDKAKTAVTATKISYLDIFQASYYYRPGDRTAVDLNNPYSVNGFQYSATLNLGMFLQKPSLVKKAKAELKVAQYESEDYNATLVTEVKRRYYNYIRLINDLKIKTQTSQDNKDVVDNLKAKFDKGEGQAEAYIYSRIKLSEANSNKIQAENDLLIAKDALEELIGQKLTDIK